MPARRTAEHIYALLDEQVLPELKSLKGDVGGLKADVADVKQTLDRAGLTNGHADDVRLYFDRRARRMAAIGYLNDVFQPVARFKTVAFIVGFLASGAWAVTGIRTVMELLPKHPH